MLIVDNRMDVDTNRLENGRANLVRNQQDHSYSNNIGRKNRADIVRKLRQEDMWTTKTSNIWYS